VKSHKLGGSAAPSWKVEIHEAAKKELLALGDADYRRMDKHLELLVHDPLRARPGMDIKKLKDVDEGSGLYRLRVGERRAIYAIITAERVVTVLVIEDRELGYVRMIHRAMARMRE
jgi:mRNA-degrading endonuclease RelE of RelBE toxin-antitoxin system